MKILADRVALLTGGLGSLGRAQAVTLARGGARVLVLDRPDIGDGPEIVATLARQAEGDISFVGCDLNRLVEAEAAVAALAENRAGIRLPYGLGFHPWFPRSAGTMLEAKAVRAWLEDERHLPIGVAPVADHPEWDFSRASLLPRSWVNNAFDGWDRRAAIIQPEDGIAISLKASSPLDVFILYSPSPDAGFFCFEPVSHPVDAHHGEGLTPLEHGAIMSASMRLGWSSLDSR